MIGQNSLSAEMMEEQNLANDLKGGCESSEVSVIDILTHLALRKWLIAKTTGIALLLGIFVSLMMPVRYTAVTKLMPPQQTQSAASLMMNQLASSGAGSLAAMAGGGLGMKSTNDIYIGLLGSRPIADSIIQKFGLIEVYRDKNMTDARVDLARKTQIASEKDGFIVVSVTDKDKKRAAEMANAYTGELRILTQTLAVTEASQRKLFYEEQLKQAKELLVSAELSFQEVQQKKGLVQLDAQAKAMIESLEALRAQVAAKEVEVQALRSYSTEKNPNVQLAERELTSLQDQAARIEQNNNSGGGLGLGNAPAAGMEYLRAEHELKYRQALFDTLMRQYDVARLDEAKEAAIIQVVEPAIEPDRKSSPKRAMITFFFTVTGLFGGCLWAMLEWCKNIANSDPHLARPLRDFKVALLGSKGEEAGK
jgi:capsule polysaccharide export protein KpsE/RkpR